MLAQATTMPIPYASLFICDRVLRVPYNEGHLKQLRHDGGLPYLRLRQANVWYFRYPAEAVMEWVKDRTHRGTKR